MNDKITVEESVRTPNIWVVIVFVILLYFSMLSVFFFINDNLFNIGFGNYQHILLAIGTIFLVGLFYYFFHKRNNFNFFSRNITFIYFVSLVLSGLLHILMDNSSLWYLKYLIIGLAIGTMFYTVNENKERKIGFLAGITSLSASLFGGEAGYFFRMDPADYPSVLHVKTFSSPLLWFCTMLFLFLSAYFLSCRQRQ